MSEPRRETDLLVIGGGATGLGIVRDAALRGLSTILVERGDLATGTTGRFHGLLHSGGRYVITDPASASECYAENLILRRTAADTIEDTGGLFVTTPWDDAAYADQFVEGCRQTGVPVEEIEPAEALRREPRLTPLLQRAFLVPDACIDAWKLAWGLARSAEAHGAEVLTYHAVEELVLQDGRVVGARVRRAHDGGIVELRARLTLNATGAWAGKVAALAGCEVNVTPGRGVMIAMNHRFVQAVVNRCDHPGDGDILVPIRTVCVIGTTDVRVDDPDELGIPPDEIDLLLDEGERLVPGFRQARALRVWVGARPLYSERADAAADTHSMTRGFTLLDHARRDGVEGFLTITGGKLTTFRLMAEKCVDAACERLGVQARCRTADEPLPGSDDGRYYHLSDRLAEREATLHDEQAICECELVSRSRLVEVMRQRDAPSLDDVRRALRLGMGPCQGGFCIYRATGILHGVEHLDAAQADAALLAFLQERWKGVRPVLYGDQLRQARLDDWIFQGLLDVTHLPA